MSEQFSDRRFESLLRSVLTAEAATLPLAVEREQVLERGRTRRTTRRGWRFGFPRLSMAGAAAAAVIVLVAGTLAFNHYVRRPGIGASPVPGAGSPAVFTEIAPGEIVDLPDWPLGERTSPPRVWSGTELIVWGDGIYGSANEGAAFNLAKGTWRVLADSPLSSRSESAVAWAGDEMLVWGGRVENTFYYDGAAYNPATDTWRLLPPAPRFFGKDPSMIWIGDEAVVFGVAGNSDTTGEYIAAAAYDPVNNSWRALANAPASVRVNNGNTWWTGTSIVAANVGFGGGQTEPVVGRMARYDLAADRWTVAEIGLSSAVVGVADFDGRVSTFINLPAEAGSPVQLIDSSGSVLSELPAFPGDREAFGDLVGAYGLWVGTEAIFEIWPIRQDAPEQIWALNPDTESWRRVDAEIAFPRILPMDAVVAGDLVLMSNRPTDSYRGTPRVCCVAPPSTGGSIYRVGVPSSTEVQ